MRHAPILDGRLTPRGLRATYSLAAGYTPNMGITAAGDEGSQVLVVDDDEAIRETLTDVLSEEGFSVATAEHGVAALGYLRTHKHPCVIVLDLMMPVMSGAEFREKQLADEGLARIPVIVMSAADRGGVIAAKLRANEFLPKPPSVLALLNSVARYC